MSLMAFTDYEFYSETYAATVGDITVPESVFGKYAMKASGIIRKHTFGNIDESDTIPDEVQMCACELAEQLYGYAQATSDSNGGNVTSEKDGTWSATYASYETMASAEASQEYEIIYNWLALTGLLYSGNAGV